MDSPENQSNIDRPDNQSDVISRGPTMIESPDGQTNNIIDTLYLFLYDFTFMIIVY